MIEYLARAALAVDKASPELEILNICLISGVVSTYATQSQVLSARIIVGFCLLMHHLPFQARQAAFLSILIGIFYHVVCFMPSRRAGLAFLSIYKLSLLLIEQYPWSPSHPSTFLGSVSCPSQCIGLDNND